MATMRGEASRKRAFLGGPDLKARHAVVFPSSVVSGDCLPRARTPREDRYPASIAPMVSPESLAFATGLPRPVRGSSTRVQVGCHELVLEGVRGGHALLWSDGKDARRYAVGLGDDGELELQLRTPRSPVHLVLREVLAMAPQARLRGYVMIPLVPTIVWRGASGREAVLVEFASRDLEAEWSEDTGAICRAVSSFLVRFPMRGGDARAVVPLVLRNETDAVCSPGFVPLQLHDEELVAIRGCLVVAPRRLVWHGTRWGTGPQRTAAGAGT